MDSSILGYRESMIDSYTCDDKGFTPVHAGVVAGYVRTYSLLSVPSSSCQMILVMSWKCAPHASKSMRNCKHLEDVLSIYTQSSKCITLRTFPLRPLSPPTLLTLCRSAACVAILLEMGFRPDYPNSYKQTPLVRTNIFSFPFPSTRQYSQVLVRTNFISHFEQFFQPRPL